MICNLTATICPGYAILTWQTLDISLIVFDEPLKRVQISPKGHRCRRIGDLELFGVFSHGRQAYQILCG